MNIIQKCVCTPQHEAIFPIKYGISEIRESRPSFVSKNKMSFSLFFFGGGGHVGIVDRKKEKKGKRGRGRKRRGCRKKTIQKKEK